MTARERFKGGGAAIADILRPFVAKHGPNFCEYPEECAKTSDASLVHGPQGVEGHVSLLAAIQAKMPGLPGLTKEHVKDGLRLLLSELCGNDRRFQMSAKGQDDWVETMQRRLRNLLRVVSQGVKKPSTPQWCKCLPWMSHLAPPASTAAEATMSAAAPKAAAPQVAAASSSSAEVSRHWRLQSVEVGFDVELQLPWRMIGGIKQPGLPIDPTGRAENEMVKALWPCGTVLELGISYGELQQRLDSVSQQGNAVICSFTHATSKNIIDIKQKVDRNLLMCAYEGKKMILSFKVSLFGRVEDQKQQLPHDDPVCQRAAAMACEIIDDYVLGKMQRCDIMDHKTEMFKKMAAHVFEKALRRSSKSTDKSLPQAAASVSDIAPEDDELPLAQAAHSSDEQPLVQAPSTSMNRPMKRPAALALGPPGAVRRRPACNVQAAQAKQPAAVAKPQPAVQTKAPATAKAKANSQPQMSMQPLCLPIVYNNFLRR